MATSKEEAEDIMKNEPIYMAGYGRLFSIQSIMFFSSILKSLKLFFQLSATQYDSHIDLNKSKNSSPFKLCG